MKPSRSWRPNHAWLRRTGSFLPDLLPSLPLLNRISRARPPVHTAVPGRGGVRPTRPATARHDFAAGSRTRLFAWVGAWPATSLVHKAEWVKWYYQSMEASWLNTRALPSKNAFFPAVDNRFQVWNSSFIGPASLPVFKLVLGSPFIAFTPYHHKTRSHFPVSARALANNDPRHAGMRLDWLVSLLFQTTPWCLSTPATRRNPRHGNRQLL